VLDVSVGIRGMHEAAMRRLRDHGFGPGRGGRRISRWVLRGGPREAAKLDGLPQGPWPIGLCAFCAMRHT